MGRIIFAAEASTFCVVASYYNAGTQNWVPAL